MLDARDGFEPFYWYTEGSSPPFVWTSKIIQASWHHHLAEQVGIVLVGDRVQDGYNINLEYMKAQTITDDLKRLSLCSHDQIGRHPEPEILSQKSRVSGPNPLQRYLYWTWRKVCGRDKRS